MPETENKLNLIKTVINAGADKPFGLLQITDSHIARGDLTGGRRQRIFDVNGEGSSERNFFAAMEYAKKNGLTVLHTGDIIDFFSQENFDFIDKYFSDEDIVFAAGNHDFCHCVGKAKEDHAYKWEKIKEIAPHIKTNMYFSSRVINGVNIVTLDNSYYLISEGQTEMLTAEAAKGYPIILSVHVPFYTEKLAAEVMRENPCAYLCGAPTELLETYEPHRKAQQTPDAATLAAIDYIKSEPLIKAVFAGHVHRNFEEKLTDTLTQYATHGSFAGYAREITVI